MKSFENEQECSNLYKEDLPGNFSENLQEIDKRQHYECYEKYPDTKQNTHSEMLVFFSSSLKNVFVMLKKQISLTHLGILL